MVPAGTHGKGEEVKEEEAKVSSPFYRVFCHHGTLERRDSKVVTASIYGRLELSGATSYTIDRWSLQFSYTKSWM